MQQSDSTKNKKITVQKSQKNAVATPATRLTNSSVSNAVRQKGGLQKVSLGF
jgi:hypothetical protein